jgi:hypothetical protein
LKRSQLLRITMRLDFVVLYNRLFYPPFLPPFMVTTQVNQFLDESRYPHEILIKTRVS